MPNWLLEFDYSIQLENGKIAWQHNKQKTHGSEEDMKEHIALLKAHSGNMKNIVCNRI